MHFLDLQQLDCWLNGWEGLLAPYIGLRVNVLCKYILYDSSFIVPRPFEVFKSNLFQNLQHTCSWCRLTDIFLVKFAVEDIPPPICMWTLWMHSQLLQLILIWMAWNICGALIQFGFYQHRHEKMLRPHPYKTSLCLESSCACTYTYTVYAM